MILKKLILNNIKSYEYEEINFSLGINCILGLNGSGKTTIIESIGFALFNFYKGKSMNQLLRFNESKGSIELDFIAQDERAYKVIRNIRQKGNGSVKIIDLENNSILFENVSEVYGFIKKVLKVEKTKEYSKMFEEIIAVPQGQYVSAFIENASSRKENFDKLFDLNKYKDLGFKIKDLSDVITKTKVKELENEISNMDGQLLQLVVKQDKLNNILDQIRIKKNALELSNEEFNEISTKKTKQENLKEKLDQIKNEIALIKAKIINHEQNQHKNNEELKLAKTSEEIINKNMVLYLRYERNSEEIKLKETLFEKYVESQNKINELVNKIEISKKDVINNKEKNEEKTKEKEERTLELNNLISDIFIQKTKFESDNEILLQKENQIKNNSSNIQKTKEELNNKILDIKLIKLKLDNISSVYYDEELNNKRIEELQEKLNNIKKINLKAKELDEALTIKKTELDTNYRNSLLTVDGYCPFLKEKCKNIEEDSLSNYFDNEMENIKEDIKKLLEEKKNLTLNINETDLLLEIQSIRNQNDIIKENSKKEDIIKHSLVRNYQGDADLRANQIVNELLNKFEIELKATNEAEEKLLIEKDDFVKEKTKINSLQLKILNNEERTKALEKELIILDQTLLTISKNISRDSLIIERLKKEVLTLKESLEKYSNLQEELIELKKENNELESKRNLYLSNIEKSKEVNKFSKAIEETAKAILELKDKSNELIVKQTEFLNIYSNKLLEEYTNDFNRLMKEISALDTFLIEKNKEKEELTTEIKRLNNLKVSRDEKSLVLKKFEKILNFLSLSRSIYTTLPLKLSKRYRDFISSAATILYQKISKENVRIEILEDYQIKVIDNVIPENTKLMDQLSGGEQMSIALAIRLSMLKYLSGLDIYFLDEPTINLDFERREQVRDVVSDVINELSQLFVISHDDTFDSITESIIKIEKVNDSSKII